MFRIDMLPAAHGDCLWLEYGDPDAPRRVLIDAGPTYTSTYQVLIDRIRALPRDQRVFELFVITHIDADHIGGAIRLLRDAEALGLRFERIWFNGYEQLQTIPRVAALAGVAQGEYLNLVIADYEKRTGETVLNRDVPTPWVGVPDDGEQVVVSLPGDLTLTVVSPGVDQLIGLALDWDVEVAELGFRSEAGPLATIREQLESSKQLRPLLDPNQADNDPGVIEVPEIPATSGLEILGGEMTLGSDASSANGSSIALLAEHDDGSALLAGDAFAPVLARSLRAILDQRGDERLRLGAFKLAHHGSAANVSKELLELLSTKHYLISTSGALFGHPHRSALDALAENHHNARGKPEFWFNHDTTTTRPWQSDESQAAMGIVSHYPAGGVSWRA